MSYRLVIFDFDGTLADTFPWFSRVLNGVADRFGFQRIEDGEGETLRGLSAQEVIVPRGVPRWKLPLIARHMCRLAAEHRDEIRLFAGVDRCSASPRRSGGFRGAAGCRRLRRSALGTRSGMLRQPAQSGLRSGR